MRRPLADDPADQLLDDVLAGRYPVGTAPPSESASREAMHAHIVQTENDMVRYVRDPAAARTALRGSDLRRV